MTIMNTKGETIATFPNALEAVLCLPAIARILGVTCVMQVPTGITLAEIPRGVTATPIGKGHQYGLCAKP